MSHLTGSLYRVLQGVYSKPALKIFTQLLNFIRLCLMISKMKSADRQTQPSPACVHLMYFVQRLSNKFCL
jgi:hypothetical protein